MTKPKCAEGCALLTSMTGYGRAACTCADFVVVVEMKSVNHRFTDVVLRFGRELFAAEERVRALVSERCARGRIEVFATIAPLQGQIGRRYEVNQPLLQAALRLARQVTGEAPIDLEGLAIGHVLALPGLFVEQTDYRDANAVSDAVYEAARQALRELVDRRQAEGERLAEHLRRRAGDLQRVCEQLRARAPDAVAVQREKLVSRLTDLLSGQTVDAQRVAIETALFAEKTSIEEEVERLGSHLRQWETVMTSGRAAGKRLEFLLQEMGREMSTIGAKSTDLAMIEAVLEGKHILEQMREQVQNVE